MQKETQDNIYEFYRILEDYVPKSVVTRKNNKKSWEYGYNEEFDMVVISKDGTIGEIYEIEGLVVAIPATPRKVDGSSKKKQDQFWERKELPAPLKKIRSRAKWSSMDDSFKKRWVGYIDEEFRRRSDGYWFMNNGKATYLPGSQYMYLQWSPIDVGYPDFREANRILYIYWEAAIADPRSYGIVYGKIRRSGFSFMGASELTNRGTLLKKSLLGVLSKTGKDAKNFFKRVVRIDSDYPFFFQPIRDGSTNPETAIKYQVPAAKITRKNMNDVFDEEGISEGLDTVIDWRNTADNSYDSEKLKFLVHDESGKWEKPVDITQNWRVIKTCLRVGRKIVGKCMMGSTVNAQKKGGAGFKKIFEESDPRTRNKNGQTKSGLYKIFIPTEWNMEGFIDKYGMPVFRTPENPIEGIDGEMIDMGAIDFWEGEAEFLADNPVDLNEFYRQYPRNPAHMFRDDAKESVFDLTRIYSQIDHNLGSMASKGVSRYRLEWVDNKPFTKVVAVPDPRGRFYTNWIPPKRLQNNVKRGPYGQFSPGNSHIGAFGCDSYDISGVVGGGGSKGALHGLTGEHIDDGPTNEFFLEYIAKPASAEIFYMDVAKALWFWGMPVLAENNKPRLLYFLKNNGMRQFSLNRPDKPKNRLSKAEKELGGIPSASADGINNHATGIETYILKHVGIDPTGKYRPEGECGFMPFDRTLLDWANYDINNRTLFDATVSSGFAIMAVNRASYGVKKEKRDIMIKFGSYDNRGTKSRLNSYED